VDAVSLDTSVPIDWASKTLKPEVVLQGNLDPVLLTIGGTALRRAVTNILSATAHRPFIFNVGHGLVPSTSPDVVGQLVAMIRGRA
jgi:uroporphyrinogen decarboxylase